MLMLIPSLSTARTSTTGDGSFHPRWATALAGAEREGMLAPVESIASWSREGRGTCKGDNSPPCPSEFFERSKGLRPGSELLCSRKLVRACESYSRNKNALKTLPKLNV